MLTIKVTSRLQARPHTRALVRFTLFDRLIDPIEGTTRRARARTATGSGVHLLSYRPISHASDRPPIQVSACDEIASRARAMLTLTVHSDSVLVVLHERYEVTGRFGHVKRAPVVLLVARCRPLLPLKTCILLLLLFEGLNGDGRRHRRPLTHVAHLMFDVARRLPNQD